MSFTGVIHFVIACLLWGSSGVKVQVTHTVAVKSGGRVLANRSSSSECSQTDTKAVCGPGSGGVQYKEFLSWCTDPSTLEKTAGDEQMCCDMWEQHGSSSMGYIATSQFESFCKVKKEKNPESASGPATKVVSNHRFHDAWNQPLPRRTRRSRIHRSQVPEDHDAEEDEDSDGEDEDPILGMMGAGRGLDIGTWGEHLGAVGTEYVCGSLTPTDPQKIREINDHFHISGSALLVKYSNETLLDGSARATLVRHLEQAWIDQLSLREPNGDFKLDLSQKELVALIGQHAMDRLARLFAEPFDQIKLRRSTAHGLCINFHLDVNRRTMQVPLNDEKEYGGGQVMYVSKDGIQFGSRVPGTATVHNNQIPHGVTKMLRGVRYGLFFLQSSQASSTIVL